MDGEKEKSTRMLDDDLHMELKIFLAGKPGGYTYIRRFVGDAVREKMARMKEKA